MMTELPKNYDPSEAEERLYQGWVDAGYFKPSEDPEKPPFTIVIPPPNVTGQLHMGHALDETLQDIIIRQKRMQGYAALWVPGTDHAGIATQIKVEETLRKEEGLTRYDLGREKFLERVWEWKNLYGGRIINQLKKLGSSCDWSRERFTMDEGCSKAVREVFVNLYEKGLIYQGNRIINWCPSCTTALSDAEVEYAEENGHFWHIRYPFADGDGEVVIATTRPETLLGDTAVAVAPDDERYFGKIGKMLKLPLCDREIPLIADEHADKNFGTGCVKITPAHDPNDFEVGLRHNLEQIRVLNDDATVNERGGKYCGMDRYEARKAIVADLEEQGYLVKIEEHAHNVGHCYRCGTTVEPITSKQWFVKMEPLAKRAIEVVKDGTIEFLPDRFSKTYMNWMENVHDWCISRQLWWGHRIPAFYCDVCGETFVSKEDMHTCPKCGAKLRQEEDVLDTWFSSALWPFSTLGWPDKTSDLERFYPTSVLVTGYDIIFFWVARMIFSGMEHLDREPFSSVLIHGIVRDSQGRKMSKSLGNGIDPLEVIKEYGADALRFALITGNSPGNDMRFHEKKVEAARNFANKIWNASRYILMNLETDAVGLPDELPTDEDRWIVSKLNTVIDEVTQNMDRYELGIALQKLYDFVWDELCDWYIELTKTRLYDKECPTRLAAQQTLCHVLSETLKLLHPFMPFITEEIWQHLPHVGESIMISEWPKYDEKHIYKEEEARIEAIKETIREIRNTRTQMNVPPSKRAHGFVVTSDPALYEGGAQFFEKLCGITPLTVVATKEDAPENSVCVIVSRGEVYIPLDELIDREKEIARLQKEEANLENEVKRVSGKLSNAGFVAKAPAAVVEEERQKLARYEQMLEKVKESLAQLLG